MLRGKAFFLPVLLCLACAPAGAAVAAETVANAIFLVAKAAMRDPNFSETVVLVTYPPDGGPFGVIVNRPLRHRLSEIFTEYESLKDRREVLFSGGPVRRDGLVFLVRGSEPPPGATRFLPDVYLTADPEAIERLLQRPDPLQGLRVYAGYSGWAPGQLQSEIARGGWHVLPADADTIFEKEPAKIWPELERRANTKRTSGREARRALERMFPIPDLAP